MKQENLWCLLAISPPYHHTSLLLKYHFQVTYSNFRIDYQWWLSLRDLIQDVIDLLCTSYFKTRNSSCKVSTWKNYQGRFDLRSNRHTPSPKLWKVQAHSIRIVLSWINLLQVKQGSNFLFHCNELKFHPNQQLSNT